ncbi:MAG: (d)CMP kinase [Candidatus Omnitrophica bacterium]|nr:(d)CMP kinase [Candidatus Omnitrophota bacterium]
MANRTLVVIDGGAGVGKTTIAEALAARLGFTYVSTGHIYRTLAFRVLERHIDEKDTAAIAAAARSLEIEFLRQRSSVRIQLDGRDITDEISSPRIVPLTSKISSLAEVRKNLLDVQRRFAREGNCVLEGRDMGTVVFPHADWKFFITASFEIRLKRMFKVMTPDERKRYPTPESYRETLMAIDKEERGNLGIAPDAIIYDNSSSPTAEQDAIVLEYYMTHGKEILNNAEKIKIRLGKTANERRIS